MHNIEQYLPLIIPIFLIPLTMRFIVSPLIFKRLKKKYIKKITSNLGESWFDPKDLESVDYLTNYAWKDLSRPFVLSYNMTRLKEQFESLFLGISRIYNSGSNKISMEFSVQKILEAAYMLFEDLHRDFRDIKLFKILEKLPINLFFRASQVNRSLRVFTRNRIIMRFNKYRITAKVLRFLLIPFLGLPIVVTQLLFSLLYSTIFEGYLRFVYGIILLKVGYYTIYLYSSRESSLYNSKVFNKEEIIHKAKIIQSRHTKFNNRFTFSPSLKEALNLLREELDKNEVPVDSELDDREFIKLSKRIFDSVKNAVSSEFDNDRKKLLEVKPLLSIFNKIGSVYYPKSSKPLFNIRVKEALEFGYFFTTISLKTVYSVPGFRSLIDRVPLKLVIDISDIINNEKVKKALPHIKKGKRIWSNLQNYYLASRALFKRGNPAIFAATMVTPIIYHHTLITLKEYVYNVSSLLLIDSLESSVLRFNQSRIEKTSK